MLQKNFGKWHIRFFLLAALVSFFFLTRFVNLTIIPIFTDEAIYLRWAQIGIVDARWRFISLIDGKQPLLIWLFYPALKLIDDPLIAGRLVSIIAGFTGMIGLASFGWYVTKKTSGFFIGAVIYLLLPFFLQYDRLAIYEALLTSISIWSLFFTYLLAKTRRLDVALILGMIVGAGLLTKSSANFFWMLLPLSLLVADWNKKNLKISLVKWVGLFAVVVVISQIFNNILRLSEFRHIIGEKNLQFLYSFSEIASDPFRHLMGNLTGLTSWLVSYLTVPLVLAVILAMWWLLQRNMRVGLFFLGYFSIPFLGLAVFGKVIYPRFLLFMLPALLIPLIYWVQYWLSKAKYKRWVYGALILILLPALYFDMKLLTDPIHAPMPYADRQQLINDWPAGYGIKEAVAYLDEQAENDHIFVGTEGTFGLYPMALELYLGKDPQVTFKPYWPVNEFPEELQMLARNNPTFLLFKERQEIPKEWPLELIAQYQRGDGPTYLKFYRVLP